MIRRISVDTILGVKAGKETAIPLQEQRQMANGVAAEVMACRDILYTVPEAAKLLRVNKNMVYDLIRCGYLRSIELGSRKVSRKALQEFVEQFEGKTVELPGVRSE